MRRVSVVVALAVGLALSGACGGTPGTPTNTPTAGVNKPQNTDTATPSEEPTSPATPSNLTFGQSYKYRDGLQITVSKPKSFQPSESAAGGEGAASHETFTITIVNGTAANYDASLFSTTAQSGNTEASEVIDADNGLDGAPSTTLIPGRESKFKIGYGVADPQDIVLEVSPGFDYDSVIFTS